MHMGLVQQMPTGVSQEDSDCPGVLGIIGKQKSTVVETTDMCQKDLNSHPGFCP